MPKGDKEIIKANLEDGYTEIANVLLDTLAIARLSGKELRTIIFVIRRTLGWQENGRKLNVVKIPFKQWREVLDMDDSHLSTLLGSLVKRHIIKREYEGPSGNNAGYFYSINTNINEWDEECVNQQKLRKIASYDKPKEFLNNDSQDLPQEERVDFPKKATSLDRSFATPKERVKKIKDNIYPVKGRKTKLDNDPDKYVKGKYGHMVRR